MKRNHFNMVEIVVSMVIILVALIGILGLLPSSIEANADAINRSAAADAADQFLHHMAARIESSWTETEAFPDAKPTKKTEDLILSSNGLLEKSNVKFSFDAPNEKHAWMGTDELPDASQNNTGIFHVTQTTGVNATDFVGEMRCWKEIYEVGPGGEVLTETKNKGKGKKKELPDGMTEEEAWTVGNKVLIAHYPPSNNGARCHTLVVDKADVADHFENKGDGWGDHYGPCLEDLDENGELSMRAEVCILNTEISWPVEMPYEKRSKVTYQMEIAKPVTVVSAVETVADVEEETKEEEETVEETEEEEDLFEIEDGEVIVNEKSSTKLKALGCALTSGGKDIPVTCYFVINGEKVYPFGNGSDPTKSKNVKKNDINDHKQHEFDAGILEGGAEISVVGISWLPKYGGYSKYLQKSSNPANANVLVLKDGDSVPDIEGFDGQDDIEEYIKDYIDTKNKKVTLKPNQAILLFELGTTNLNSSAADFQDMVVLVTITPQE